MGKRVRFLLLGLILVLGTSGAAWAADNITSGTPVSTNQDFGTGAVGINPAAPGDTAVTLEGTARTVEVTGSKLATSGTAVEEINVSTITVNLNGTGGDLATNGSGVAVKTVNVDNASINVGGVGGTLKTVNLQNSGGVSPTTGGALNILGTGTNVSVDTLTMVNGSTVFVDPTWTPNYDDRAALAIGTITGGIAGNMIVGQNSQLTLGTTDTAWMDKIVQSLPGRGVTNTTPATWVWGQNNLTAAYGLYTEQVLAAGGGILVDGSVTDTGGGTPSATPGPDTANFESGSLTVVNAGNTTGINRPGTRANAGIALTGTDSTATIDDNAYLYIVDANIGTVNVLSNFDDGGGTDQVNVTDGWGNGTNATNTLAFDNYMLRGTGAASTDGSGAYDVTVTRVDARDVFANISGGAADMLNSFVDGQNIDTQAEGAANAGIRFVSRATSRTYLSDLDTAKVMQGGAQLATVAGVQGITFNISQTITDTISNRANILNDPMDTGKSFSLWATPFYKHSDVDGMDSGRFSTGYKADYGGATIGGDYRFNDCTRFGLAFSVGGGDSESKGDFFRTENDYDFWGLSLYGGWNYGDFGLYGDVSYMASDNDFDQRIPTSLGMGSKIKGSADSDVFSVGLTAEYRFMAGELDVTPHLGLRYSRLTTDDYNVRGDGGNIFRVNPEDQNIWTIPVGIKFSREFATQNWNVTPKLDLGVIFAAGDTDAESRSRVVNTNAVGRLESEVVDDVTGNFTLGIDARSDNGFAFGVDANVKASKNLTDVGVMGTLRYEFD